MTSLEDAGIHLLHLRQARNCEAEAEIALGDAERAVELAEADLSRWAEHRQFPIIPCTLCGSQQNLQRVQIGNMIREWQKKFPGRIENMFSALQNVVPSHLMDASLHDFKNLKITGLANEDGDKAFDDESFEAPNVMASLQGVQVVQL